MIINVIIAISNVIVQLHDTEIRVGRALQTVSPGFHHMRVNKTERSMNPVPYKASYFGEKLHIDQNEKLVMFGVTHACAIDGYSGKIVGFITMPVKNNIEIYTHLFRYVNNDNNK